MLGRIYILKRKNQVLFAEKTLFLAARQFFFRKKTKVDLKKLTMQIILCLY
jgi:hypothetical protein